jgi:cell division transport system permease protein
MIGSLSAFVVQWAIYTLVTDMLVGSYSLSFITTLPFSAVAIPMFFVFIAIGFGVGVIGSSMAIKNYLRV